MALPGAAPRRQGEPALTAQATANAVALRWTETPTAARDQLWVWWNAETGWQRVDDGNLTGTAYTHTDVTAGRTCVYTIRTVGETGAWAQWVQAAVPAMENAR